MPTPRTQAQTQPGDPHGDTAASTASQSGAGRHFRGLPGGWVTSAWESTGLNRIELLRDVFIWSYERSAARYAAVRQSLGEPDPFRLRYRDALRSVVAEVGRGRMDRRTAAARVETWASGHVEEAD